MKFLPILQLLIFGLLLSCNKEVPLTFSSETITEKSLGICKTAACPEITLNYILAVGEKDISENINTQINETIINALNFSIDSISSSKTLEEAANQFVTTYQNDILEFPDISSKYVAEINIELLSHSANIISIESSQYFYTGGAHGYEKISFLNIDPKTGIKIPFESLLTNSEDFTAFVEEKFRMIHNIGLDDSINSTGFWFENDIFYLPENVGFTDNKLLFIYNQYDIASYADGPIQFEILKDEANPFLKIK